MMIIVLMHHSTRLKNTCVRSSARQVVPPKNDAAMCQAMFVRAAEA